MHIITALVALALVASSSSALRFQQPKGFIPTFRLIGTPSSYNPENMVVGWGMDKDKSTAGTTVATSGNTDAYHWRMLTSDLDSTIFALQNVQAANEGKPACLSTVQAYPPLLEDCNQPTGYMSWKVARTVLENKGCMSFRSVGDGLSSAEAVGLSMARDNGGLTFHSNWDPDVNNNLCWNIEYLY
ncbi:MAG: hypothetical protein DHS80DRAFT_28992 [Piptocephalis tieghemiana]|nr:MAG: hypothetical protein DHS80DRAFT_28992 [Piptocephalis tieghemiana]